MSLASMELLCNLRKTITVVAVAAMEAMALAADGEVVIGATAVEEEEPAVPAAIIAAISAT